MRKPSPRWTKILKIFHVLCPSIWIGGGAAMVVLTAAVGPDTTAEACMHARTLKDGILSIKPLRTAQKSGATDSLRPRPTG